MYLKLQNIILEMIATGQPLAETVDVLCREVEAMRDDIVCSVLLLDDEMRLRHLAGPSLPLEYTSAIDGVAAGPGVGSCGTAAHVGQPVIVEDIDTHPYWQAYKQLALPIGLKACWSTPIIGAGKVLGTFAFYYRVPRGPRKEEEAVVEACVHLCAIAIERDQRIAERRRMAQTDHLTGLPNRSRFNDTINDVARRGSDWALMLIDLDNLKMVNDTFGHGAGDDLIQIVAQRLKEMAPANMTFRIGGDEFAVIVPCLQTMDPGQLAERLIDRIKEPADCNGHLVYPAATLGGAKAGTERSPQQVRQNADYALYHAKERARGRYLEYAPGLGTSIVQRFRAVQEVDRALREDRIDAHFQPIIELSTGRIMGFESLCRMQMADGTIVAAAHFHEAMKDAHVAIEITDRMLERIATAAIEWQQAGLLFSRVGLNLSAADFHRGGLTRRITDALARVGLPPTALAAEVTESVYLAQKDNVVADEIHALREAGIKVALDDFGTGFASLTHLLTVPVDIIKIDKCFVRRLSDVGGGAVITKGLLEIARGLGIWVVAEGIEEQSQAEHLLSLECRAGQGYFFSRAVDRHQTAAFLRKNRFHPEWSQILQQQSPDLHLPKAG